MNLFKKLFSHKEEEPSNSLTHEQIAAFEAMRVKQSMELKCRKIDLLEPPETKGIPTHLVLSYKDKAIATLYRDTFVTSPQKFSKKDQQNVNKILGELKKHYE